jgi:hypothetical protein
MSALDQAGYQVKDEERVVVMNVITPVSDSAFCLVAVTAAAGAGFARAAGAHRHPDGDNGRSGMN